MLLAIIIGLVVVVAGGILLAVFLSGDKPSVNDLDDDSDITIADTEAPPDDTQAPPDDTEAPPDDTEAPPDDTQAPPDDDNDTQPPETTAPPQPGTGYPALVGVWSIRKWDEPVASLPASYAQRAYDTDTGDSAALHALVEDIRKDIKNTEYVYFYVFREDGTAYYLGVFGSGYMLTTYNYHVEGDILHSTNMVTTSEDLAPGWVIPEDQPDAIGSPFRIIVSGEQERLYILPDFPEDSEYAGITMDDFMTSPVAEHYFMIKVM